jgi:hypothetical protein
MASRLASPTRAGRLDRCREASGSPPGGTSGCIHSLFALNLEYPLLIVFLFYIFSVSLRTFGVEKTLA